MLRVYNREVVRCKKNTIQAFFAGLVPVLQAFNTMRIAACFCRAGLDFEGF
jgi:hypothetical protein